ncbi:hypothetical protein ABZ532_00425 [Streptomyces sp. NPDC019396]|uniref:hypothetical protein n=1 Tax=Streptomyces sp. NPDC019396 TaxID=3154687 RepID=UPI00340D5678
MTHTPLTAVSPAPPSRARKVLRAVEIASCVPYLALKVAWIAGSRIGIPEGSVLLEHRALMAVVNSVTVLMDGAVIVLALLLTQPWGRRLPSWLLAVAAWGAGGLLVPIMVGFPVQSLLAATNGAADPGAAMDGKFLDPWVFDVVYTGFIIQGLCLGTLFVLYARERWAHLWQGRVGDLPDGGRGLRAAAMAGAVLALFLVALHALWALGATTGLSRTQAARRGPDFHVLQTVDALYLVAAAAGLLMLAFRRGRALPVRLPLGMAWLGSGAVGCWGAWLLFAAALPVTEGTEGVPQLTVLTYAGGMIVGLLVAACTAVFLRRRGTWDV